MYIVAGPPPVIVSLCCRSSTTTETCLRGYIKESWNTFYARFGSSSPRRTWLVGRLLELLELANTNGKLRRAFVWGSFVTSKPSPRDLDVLLIMDEEFEVDGIEVKAQAAFDSTRARLLFEADVFWARASIGNELLGLWLDTYQTSRSFRKRGIVELELQ
jgi:hypothetical protein